MQSNWTEQRLGNILGTLHGLWINFDGNWTRDEDLMSLWCTSNVLFSVNLGPEVGQNIQCRKSQKPLAKLDHR